MLDMLQEGEENTYFLNTFSAPQILYTYFILRLQKTCRENIDVFTIQMRKSGAQRDSVICLKPCTGKSECRLQPDGRLPFRSP
jgi:BarA-like signal transduction histidine kinase